MGYIKMNCPACGGALEYSGDREFFFCEYCGTKIVKDKQFVELSGEVSVSGIASADALLERAFLFLEDRNFASADKYLEKVLDANPKCAKAYMGKLMCQLQVSDPNALAAGSVPLTQYAFYNKAVRFAGPDEMGQYQAYNQTILDKIAAMKDAKLAELESIKEQIAGLDTYLEENKKQHTKDTAKKVLWKILLIISICGVAFWTLGTIFAWPLVIIDIPFIVWMIFMIRLNSRAKKSTQQYEAAKSEIESAKETLSEKEACYAQWLRDNSF